jgi:light-regulated signal transduction histidine kinase (bacteriophytochrome)
MERRAMSDTSTFDTADSDNNLQYDNNNIVERQAVQFAKEFSLLYKSEKKKRAELETLAGELKERNEELMDIVFLTSNQFLEPINNLKSSFALIREHEGFPQLELEELSEKVLNSVESLHYLVKEMSKLYRVKSMRSLFRPVSLDKVLAEVLQEFQTSLQEKESIVQVDPLPSLETDSVQLRILFRQLVILGTSFKEPGEPSVLRIKAECNARGLWRITFQAKGSISIKENLDFEKYDRRRGFDRGLDICQRISQRLGGFLYGEIFSEGGFSYHVVLPEKNIPQASLLKSQMRNY